MRSDRDTYYLQMARLAATRSTCLRRAVGCVLVDARGHVLAIGYNGVAAGLPHCNQLDPATKGHPFACAGATANSGESLDACGAIHAEANALLQCPNVYAIETCYTTTAPCTSCVKLLLGTSCRRIVFLERYPQIEAERLWRTAGRAWGQR